MLAVDKITAAFNGVLDEAEKMNTEGLSADQKAAVENIITIARHQNDVRGMEKISACYQ